MKNDNPIRTSQLIRPFGVGSLYVTKEGAGLIACGLDHWYKSFNGASRNKDELEEFLIYEWRLQRQLNVSHFRSPPEFREKDFTSTINDKNTGLEMPFLRFPKWHFCKKCRKMEELALHRRGKPRCRDCKLVLIQVPIVVICESGHIQDFPWNEWVHRTASPTCDDKNLFYKFSGSPGLQGQRIECGTCKKSRTLGGVLFGTRLQDSLSTEHKYSCSGKRIWNHQETPSPCNSNLRATLRSSSNIYYAVLESSIFVPENFDSLPEELIKIFNSAVIRTKVDTLNQIGHTITPDIIRDTSYKKELKKFSDEQILRAIKNMIDANSLSNSANIPKEENQNDFKFPEYLLFQKNNDSDDSRTIVLDKTNYKEIVSNFFDKITLVKTLKKTEVLCGFNRILPNGSISKRELSELMWAERPEYQDSWLPAVNHKGEGIFLQFKEDMIKEFENREVVLERVRNFKKIIQREWEASRMNPRYIFLHTFAHLLINTLIYECGYGAAALQERIYSSNDEKNPMAGILIYTSSGNKEATMGGLVRMGQPDYLERVIEKCIENSKWCSVDPVCMEVGEVAGQGPYSSNLASCHNCSLVPETSCEFFNSYLDRGFVTGNIKNDNLGFFSKLI